MGDNYNLSLPYSSYESHITQKHNNSKQQQLLVALFLLDQAEIAELFSSLQPRLNKFKAVNDNSNAASKVAVKEEVIKG